jgi:DnaJ family protein C protein 4
MFHRCLSQCSLCALHSPALTFSHKRFLSQSSALLRQYKRTHYEVLGLSPAATQSDIRDAFVKLSKEVHPDMNPDDPDNHSKFVQLNEAYTVLSKLNTRREYDVGLAYMSRTTATSHSAGASYSPGSGVRADNYDSNHEHEKVFWDDTIWEMRDRSKDKDAFYAQHSYYGIRGIPRQSNEIVALVVVLSVGFLAFGHFYFGFWLSKKKSRETYEKNDKKNLRILKEVEARARMNGSVRQTEILKARADIEAAKRRARGVRADRVSATAAAAEAAAVSAASTVTVSAAVAES